jgi:hypothetical protein
MSARATLPPVIIFLLALAVLLNYSDGGAAAATGAWAHER